MKLKNLGHTEVQQSLATCLEKFVEMEGLDATVTIEQPITISSAPNNRRADVALEGEDLTNHIFEVKTRLYSHTPIHVTRQLMDYRYGGFDPVLVAPEWAFTEPSHQASFLEWGMEVINASIIEVVGADPIQFRVNTDRFYQSKLDEFFADPTSNSNFA